MADLSKLVKLTKNTATRLDNKGLDLTSPHYVLNLGSQPVELFETDNAGSPGTKGWPLEPSFVTRQQQPFLWRQEGGNRLYARGPRDIEQYPVLLAPARASGGAGISSTSATVTDDPKEGDVLFYTGPTARNKFWDVDNKISGPAGVTSATGLWITAAGDILILSNDDKKVYAYDRSAGTWDSGTAVTGAAAALDLNGIYVDSSNDIYIGAGSGPGSIWKYDSSAGTWSGVGNVTTGFPVGVTADADGDLSYLNRVDGRLYNRPGPLIAGAFNARDKDSNPQGAQFVGSSWSTYTVYFVGRATKKVYTFRRAGGANTWSETPIPSVVTNPGGVYVRDGVIYIVDTVTGDVYSFIECAETYSQGLIYFDGSCWLNLLGTEGNSRGEKIATIKNIVKAANGLVGATEATWTKDTSLAGYSLQAPILEFPFVPADESVLGHWIVAKAGGLTDAHIVDKVFLTQGPGMSTGGQNSPSDEYTSIRTRAGATQGLINIRVKKDSTFQGVALRLYLLSGTLTAADKVTLEVYQAVVKGPKGDKGAPGNDGQDGADGDLTRSHFVERTTDRWYSASADGVLTGAGAYGVGGLLEATPALAPSAFTTANTTLLGLSSSWQTGTPVTYAFNAAKTLWLFLSKRPFDSSNFIDANTEEADVGAPVVDERIFLHNDDPYAPDSYLELRVLEAGVSAGAGSKFWFAKVAVEQNRGPFALGSSQYLRATDTAPADMLSLLANFFARLDGSNLTRRFRNDVRSPSDPYTFAGTYTRKDNVAGVSAASQWSVSADPVVNGSQVQLNIWFAGADRASAIERWLIGNELVIDTARFELKGTVTQVSGNQYQAAVVLLEGTMPAVNDVDTPVLEQDTPHRKEFVPPAFAGFNRVAGELTTLNNSYVDLVTGAKNGELYAITVEGSISTDAGNLVLSTVIQRFEDFSTSDRWIPIRGAVGGQRIMIKRVATGGKLQVRIAGSVSLNPTVRAFRLA